MKQHRNQHEVEYLSFYLLYEPNHALREFIATPKFQFQNFDLGAKWSKISIFHLLSK